jgi:hypothetical protein
MSRPISITEAPRPHIAWGQLGNNRTLVSVLLAALLMNGQAQATAVPTHSPKARKEVVVCAPNATSAADTVGCEGTILGRVINLTGPYDDSIGESDFSARGILGQCEMEVRSADQSVNDIHVVSSTVVFPAGTRIRPGARVIAIGHKVDHVFIAREVRILSY